MKLRLGILLAMVVLVWGCNPASRAQDWARSATAETWHARYRLTFHQKDGDLEASVLETQGEYLVLDIQMPLGSIRLEYGPGGLLIDLDKGDLSWLDVQHDIPYYSLAELARYFALARELNTQGDWAELTGYRLKVKGGVPTEAAYLSEWTLIVEEFVWE